MSEATPKFVCDGCQRKYVWKPELVGKRAKCKACGNVITIPAQPWQPEPPPTPPEDDLYSFAEPDANSRQTPIKPPPLAMVATADSGEGAGVGALEYQRGPTAREKQLNSDNMFVQMPRDRYVPISAITIGALLFISYNVMHSPFGASGLGIIVAVLTIVTLIQTALLVGFALLVAGPLGVGFGSLWTAVLKLAAISVFIQGTGPWISAFTHGAGFAGFFVNIAVALLLYWIGLAYLFEMDASESALVVALLSLFQTIINVILFVLLLMAIANLSSRAGPGSVALSPRSNPILAAITPTAPPAPPPAPASLTFKLYEDAAKRGRLTDAAKWAADQKMAVELIFIKSCYAAGATNVQFELIPIGIGHTGADFCFVTLPTDKAARAKCFDLAKDYYAKRNQEFVEPGLLQDTGDPWLAVQLPLTAQ